jgi:flavin reductase (DIM6/NTAB) family NADH-FMN oxidoreductase RutF
MKINPNDLSRLDKYRLLISTLVPRPIALISTISEDGILNAAPFSFFGGLSSTPPLLGVSISNRRGEKKDTVRNIEFLGDFVVNIVNEDIAEQMNLTSGDYPPEVDEYKIANLTPQASEIVQSPRIAESPVSLECRVYDKMEIRDSINTLIIGEVVLFHIIDDIWAEGEINPFALKAVGRLGISKYCRTTDVFEMIRPKV